jgi:hypothetical protein
MSAARPPHATARPTNHSSGSATRRPPPASSGATASRLNSHRSFSSATDIEAGSPSPASETVA